MLWNTGECGPCVGWHPRLKAPRLPMLPVPWRPTAPRSRALVGLVARPAWSSEASRGRSAPTWWSLGFSEPLGVGSLSHFCERTLLPFLESCSQESSRARLCVDNCRPQSPVPDNSPGGFLKSPSAPATCQHLEPSRAGGSVRWDCQVSLA